MKRLKNFAFIAALFGMVGSVSAEVVFEETLVKSNSSSDHVCVNVLSREITDREVVVNLMAVHRTTYNDWANLRIEDEPAQFPNNDARYNFSITVDPGISQECFTLVREEVSGDDYDVDILVYILGVENSEYFDQSVPMAITGIRDNYHATHNLIIEQNGHLSRVVNSEEGFGDVTIRLESDDFENDPLYIDWSASDNRFTYPTSSFPPDPNVDVSLFTVDLIYRDDDVYKLTVGVSEKDGNTNNYINFVPLTEYISVKFEENDKVEATGADTDLDGVSDVVEGGAEPEILTAKGQFNARTQPGLKLRLSEIPLKAGLYSPELTYTKFQEASEILPDQNHGFFSYVSFEVEGIEVYGSRVGIVLELDNPFSFDDGAVFPFINGMVKNFDPDTSFDSRRDYALSAPKDDNGNCPDMDRKKYSAPQQGDECLLILVTDGGSNDADSWVNGRVTFNAFLGKSQDIFDSDDNTKSKSKMGPGSFNLSILAALIILLSYRTFRKK